MVGRLCVKRGGMVREAKRRENTYWEETKNDSKRRLDVVDATVC